ncbi:MAG: biotin/lipoyl-binding protein [Longimicrobiales bacterium]|nr:biotin/lipoyl-binding protein [Longimicrobiales bacterium]
MRYFVKIGARELDVELGPTGIRVDGMDVDADLLEMDGTEVHSLLLGGASHRILATRSGAEEWTLHLSGLQLRAQVVDERTRAIREMTGVKEGGLGPRALRAPMPGLVIKVEAGEGDEVVPGQGLVIVEAMKMENELKSERGGRISRVLVEAGQIVQKDQVLVEFEDSRTKGSNG